MRFWAIWVTSVALETSGALTLAFTFVACVLVFEYGRQIGLPADEFTILVAGLAALGIPTIIAVGLLAALAFFLTGQLLLLLLHMERNSRHTSEVLAAELNKLIFEEIRRLYGVPKEQ